MQGKKIKSAIGKTGLVFVSLTISFVFAELLLRQMGIVGVVGPSFSTYDPVYGKVLKANFTAERRTPEFQMNFSTNSHGFRGPELKESGSSILFIGDSFTMGYGVSNGQEFPQLVRQALLRKGSDVSVVNAGIGNAGTGRWIKFLRREAKRYAPSLIVFQIHQTDFRDNIREKLFDIGPNGKLIEVPIQSMPFERQAQAFVEAIPGLAASHILGLLRQINLSKRFGGGDNGVRMNIRSPLDSDRAWRLTKQLLNEVVQICRSERWQLLILLADMDEQRGLGLMNYFSERNIHVINFPNKSERPDLYFTIDGHWNTKGHALASRLILRAIASRQDLRLGLEYELDV